MHENPTGGKYMIFFSQCLYLGHAIIVLLSQTVYWGKILQEGNQIIFFPLNTIFFCDSIWAEYINWGKIYDIFSPSVFIFPTVSLFFPPVSSFFHAINCSTFAGSVLGENILCLCFSPCPCYMVFILPFFLDSFLDMSLRRNNIIFSPWSSFFPTCDRKTCKKINGGKKNGIFFPFPYFSPMDHAVFGSPSQTVTVLRCMKMMIFTLGLNVHSSACKFNDFVMNNPDNCSFNHFFF